MNTLNEFIFITAGITVAFTILIIGLIRTNSTSKKEIIKKSVVAYENEFQYAEKMKKSAEELKANLDVAKQLIKEKDIQINQLSKTVEFKDSLIHGYKEDLKQIILLQNEKNKMQEAIEYLEELNGKSMSQVAELNQENDKLKQHCQLISEDLVKNANGMKIARETDEENKRLNKIIEECAIYIMKKCK